MAKQTKTFRDDEFFKNHPAASFQRLLEGVMHFDRSCRPLERHFVVECLIYTTPI
jgi:hypothetical protein